MNILQIVIPENDLAQTFFYCIDSEKKALVTKNIQDGHQKNQDGYHENKFITICSAAVNKCDKLIEQNRFITFRWKF